MMKNKIVNFFLLLLIGTIFIIIVRTVYGESSNSMKYIVYQSTEDDFLVKLFRIIPKTTSQGIIEEIIQTNNVSRLVEVFDKRHHIPRSYYFLENKDGVKLIKSPIVKVNDKVSFENYYSFLIDKNVFNEYIETFFPNIDEERIIEKYCFFLSSIRDSSYYQKLNDSIDISLIKKRFRKIEEMPLPENKYFLNIQYVLEMAKTDNNVLYWFYDKGVLQISYKFLNNKLDTIDVRFLGYLGNEIIHL